jgi:energy-coupling factor transporter ATP-binding protein EcfA2
MVSSTNQNLADIMKIQALLDEGDVQISKESQNALALVGTTGSGKTTLLNLLTGNPLRITEDRLIDVNDPRNPFKIGFSFESCTTTPNTFSAPGYTIYDCPGFEDNKSTEQEIANAYYISKIFKMSMNIKIVLVLIFKCENNGKGKQLCNIFSMLAALIPDQQKLFNSLSIVVTQCKKNYTNLKFANTLKKLVAENNSFAPISELVSKIADNPQKVVLFKKPDKLSGIDYSDRERILRAITLASYIRSEARPVISDTAKIQVSELIKVTEIKITEMIISFASALKNKFFLETNIQELKNASQSLDKIAGQNKNQTLKEFGDSLDELAKFLFQIDSNLQFIKDMIFRIEFYQKFTCVSSYKFNILLWTQPLQELRLQITEALSIQDQKLKEEQAAAYEKAHQEEVKEYKRVCEEYKKSYQAQVEFNARQETIFREAMASHQRQIAQLNEIINRPPQIVHIYEDSDSICNII